MSRESEIERSDRRDVESQGGLLLKFVSPGFNGVPDRILLRQVPPEHQEIVARYFRFVEYKKRGKPPRPDQLRRHKDLRDLGYAVDVIDTKGTL